MTEPELFLKTCALAWLVEHLDEFDHETLLSILSPRLSRERGPAEDAWGAWHEFCAGHPGAPTLGSYQELLEERYRT